MTGEGLPVQTACRVMDVSESGFHAWCNRPPPVRAVRHVRLTGMIRQVHSASRGVHGGCRVHAEPPLGHGITVNLVSGGVVVTQENGNPPVAACYATRPCAVMRVGSSDILPAVLDRRHQRPWSAGLQQDVRSAPW
ncbi:hypothetical protein ABZ260_19700 [Streptosporangium sp. NPDC006013]|uniref:hypothetical protein n=1 Tax=Streptosporangium sp. NPDC006013 TaxID=3155596 RepID=UPI0033BE7309